MITTTVQDIVDIIHRVYVDSSYIAEVGRVATRKHLEGLTEEDFIIHEYSDKNKPISGVVQGIGSALLRRSLFPLAERFWREVDKEIVDFSRVIGRRINRGIPLGNVGVAQIAQGRAVEGLFHIYRAYEDDRISLQHLPGVINDAETEIANSPLYRQFENRLVGTLFNHIVSKYKSAFATGTSEADLSAFLSSLKPDKKLLLYMIIQRFTSAYALDRQLTTFISRGEMLRAVSDLAVWFEEEVKIHKSKPSETLIPLLDRKLKAQLNLPGYKYASASSLGELATKITASLSTSDSLAVQHARIIACVRNFAGHNLEVQDHPFFQTCDEVFARMLSFIMYAKAQGWM